MGKELVELFSMFSLQNIHRNNFPCWVGYFKPLVFKHYKEKWSEEINQNREHTVLSNLAS